MPIQIMEGPSLSVVLAGDGAANTPPSLRWRVVGCARLVGLLEVTAPELTPALVISDKDYTQTEIIELQQDDEGNYVIGAELTMPYVELFPGGVTLVKGTPDPGDYTDMSFTAQILPGSGAGSGGGGGGGGGGVAYEVENDFSGAIAQNAQTVAELALQARKVTIELISLTASDLLDYEVLIYDAAGGSASDFVGKVSMSSANAVLVVGDSLYMYEATCSISYIAPPLGDQSLWVGLSPRSGGKNATTCLTKVTYRTGA